jgi:urea transport system substrate-binding protein
MKYTHRLIAFVVVLMCVSACGTVVPVLRESPIRVGLLFSLSGTMSISETPVMQAAQMAIEEINAAGGVLGRSVEAVIVDGQSDWDLTAAEAERLITQENVSAMFGCWTSACRKTVLPVFEEHNHLLFYPLQYEGLEQSPNIIYTGAAPNQQIIPAVKWSLDNLGDRFFLVGSDYVFPRTANAIIRDQVMALGGEVVGEDYILLGSVDVDAVVAQIVETQPDVILNTINGDSNIAFFTALRAAGIMPETTPTVSFSIAEAELQSMDYQSMIGDYAAWNYFQSVETATNLSFVERFRARYGEDRVTSDPMESAYIAVYLWAQAVEDAGTDAVVNVNAAIGNTSFNAPEGVVYVDSLTRHLWKTVRIGNINAQGLFDIVWSSQNPIRPQPYPAYRTREAWDAFLQDLYLGWGGNWANPGT